MHELMVFERQDLLIPEKQRASTENFIIDHENLNIIKESPHKMSLIKEVEFEREQLMGRSKSNLPNIYRSTKTMEEQNENINLEGILLNESL